MNYVTMSEILLKIGFNFGIFLRVFFYRQILGGKKKRPFKLRVLGRLSINCGHLDVFFTINC